MPIESCIADISVHNNLQWYKINMWKKMLKCTRCGTQLGILMIYIWHPWVSIVSSTGSNLVEILWRTSSPDVLTAGTNKMATSIKAKSILYIILMTFIKPTIPARQTSSNAVSSWIFETNYSYHITNDHNCIHFQYLEFLENIIHYSYTVTNIY